MTQITREEYEIWKDNAVTRFVMAGLANAADLAAEQWKAVAWARSGLTRDDEMRAAELDRTKVQARAEAYRDLASLSFEDAMGANGLEIEDDA